MSQPRLLALLLTALVSVPAHADAGCTGYIDNVWTKNDGSVFALQDAVGHYTKMCNLNTPWFGISTSTCFGWFSALNSAVIYNKPVAVYYEGPYSCTTLPADSDAPPPYYLQLRKTP